MRITAIAPFLLLAAAVAHGATTDRLLRPGMTIRDSVGLSPSIFTLEVPANTAVSIHVRRKGVYLELHLRRASAEVDYSDDSNGTAGEEM